MIDRVCSRCNNRFYTAYMRDHIDCPYCGFNVSASNGENRTTQRSAVRRQCVLFMGSARGRGETVDVSTDGAGIRVDGGPPLKEKDTLKIIIEDLEIDSNAEVVWLKDSGGGKYTAGVKFTQPGF